MGNLRRVRWAVRAVLALGVAASVTANILHAQPNPISQAIAAWPPCALLLTVELISRVPVHTRWLAVGRFVATAVIAGIAAWVSYWHMVGVAFRYGESDKATAYLLPLTVDGLVVVASICLVELAGRIAAAERTADEPAPVLPAPGEVGSKLGAPVRPHTPSVRRAPRRTARPAATIEDVAELLREWTDGEPTRDKVAAALRDDGKAVSNKRAGHMLDELRASVRELVPA